MRYNKLVYPKNSERIILTGTTKEMKVLLSKISVKPEAKVTCRKLRSYKKPIYRVWIS